MRETQDSVWQRQGVSWIWQPQALSAVATAPEVLSMRQFIQFRKNWPDHLPSNNDKTMVVAGLDGCLDLLSPEDGEGWLAEEMKAAILSFQDHYDGGAALLFWLPHGANRIVVDNPTDAVRWNCAAPHTDRKLDFGRVLWGEATDYPQHIMLSSSGEPAGLFHRRIS